VVKVEPEFDVVTVGEKLVREVGVAVVLYIESFVDLVTVFFEEGVGVLKI